VIAADGANSVLARETGRPALRGVVPALEVELTLSAEEMQPLLGAARFDFGFVPAGYAWVFPKRDHLSVGVLTTQRGAANLHEYYRRYLELIGVKGPRQEERHGYLIPCCPRSGLFDVARVFFVGDAAGLADPVTAEGITAGILSGQKAAQAILRGGGDARAALRIYEEDLRRTLLRELRAARWLARVVYDCPRLRRALFMRHGQRLSELVTQIVTGEASYFGALRSPRNYLKLFSRRR